MLQRILQHLYDVAVYTAYNCHVYLKKIEYGNVMTKYYDVKVKDFTVKRNLKNSESHCDIVCSPTEEISVSSHGTFVASSLVGRVLFQLRCDVDVRATSLTRRFSRCHTGIKA